MCQRHQFAACTKLINFAMCGQGAPYYDFVTNLHICSLFAFTAISFKIFCSAILINEVK